MKVTNEALRALQDAELKKLRPQAQSGDFSELLSRQIENGQNTGAAVGNAGVHSLERQVPITALSTDAVAGSSNMFEEAAAKMDDMFTSFERYAQQLGGGGESGLKKAYGLLQDLSGSIADFKEAYPEAATDMPGMSALLNEMDVLATTETFKFNRGDYL